jgi:2-iminoacetate synthase ThiH
MMLESLHADLPALRGAPDKVPTRRLATLEAAGAQAIPFTTGILVGIGESPADRLAALTAIAESHRRHGARRGPTWREVVLIHAIARIAYRGTIDHIQASWVKLGLSGARQLLRAGVDDRGGTLMNENISRAAGASHGQMVAEAEP